jgi:hypothetical protein
LKGFPDDRPTVEDATQSAFDAAENDRTAGKAKGLAGENARPLCFGAAERPLQRRLPIGKAANQRVSALR